MSKMIIYDIPHLVAAMEHSQQNVTEAFKIELARVLASVLRDDGMPQAEKIELAVRQIAEHSLPKIQREKGLEHSLLHWRTQWLCEEQSGEERELHVTPEIMGDAHPHSFFWREMDGLTGLKAGLVGGIIYHRDNNAWSIHT